MNDIVQALRFHTSVDYTLYKRHEAMQYNLFVPLIVDPVYIVPFEVAYDKSGGDYSLLTTAEVVNFRTGRTVDLLSYFTFMYFTNSEITKQYISYASGSIMPALKQGIYYIHLVNGDDEWWSDLFKVGIYNEQISIEYTNDDQFSNIIFHSRQMLSATYRGRSFDNGEYSEHSESQKTIDNRDVYTYRRVDKLRSCEILGDSNVVDLLKVVQMCSSVYFTDESGKRDLIEILEVATEPQGKSNYLKVTFKYWIKKDSSISVQLTPTVRTYTQSPVSVTPPEEVQGGLKHGGKILTHGGKPLKKG